jgi:hypothetical protein
MGAELDPEITRTLYEMEFLNVSQPLVLLFLSEWPDHLIDQMTWRSHVRYLGKEREIAAAGVRAVLSAAHRLLSKK